MTKKAFFIILLFSAMGMHAQELVKCGAGKAFWLIKNNGSTIALQLTGTAEKANHERLITLDGKNLQFLVTDKKIYEEKAGSADDMKVLAMFVSGETGHIVTKLMATIEIKSEVIALANGKKAIYWSYQMPDGHNDEVVMQHYINAVEGDVIFGLASADFEGDNPVKTKQLLVDTLGTLAPVKDSKNLCK